MKAEFFEILASPEKRSQNNSRPAVPRREGHQFDAREGMDQQMRRSLISQHGLADFYEHDVLPALFQRLDRAFPEFHWSRQGRSWLAVSRAEDRENGPLREALICHQPWGFQGTDGRGTSWLSYINGGKLPSASEFTAGIRKLAELAGVDSSFLDRPVSRAEQVEAAERERQRELLEVFAAYCHELLAGEHGATVRECVQRDFSFDPRQANDIPLGVYSTRQDVHDYLRGVGFSEEDIDVSTVAGDDRLAGRLIIPWRDRWGQISTIVAYDVLRRDAPQERRLFLKVLEEPLVFGLDWNLRPVPERNVPLVLVEGLLEAIQLRVSGVPNVASVGDAVRLPRPVHWDMLGSQGVSSVILAFGGHREGQQRALEALRNYGTSVQPPQVYVLPPDSFGESRTAGAFVRHFGPEAFRQLLSQKREAFVFAARALVQEHKLGEEWSAESRLMLLRDAMKFDEAIRNPGAGERLEAVFWPTIFDALSSDWNRLRRDLGEEVDSLRERRSRQRFWRSAATSLRHLLEAYRERDRERFSEVVQDLRRLLQQGTEGTPPRDKPAEKPTLTTSPAPRRVTAWVSDAATEHVDIPRSQIPFGFTEQDVRRTAYSLWEKNGCPEGLDLMFWKDALELLQRGATPP